MFIRPAVYAVLIQLVLLVPFSSSYWDTSIGPCIKNIHLGTLQYVLRGLAWLVSALCWSQYTLTVHSHSISLAYRSMEVYRYIRTSSFLCSWALCQHSPAPHLSYRRHWYYPVLVYTPYTWCLKAHTKRPTLWKTSVHNSSLCVRESV